MGYADPTPHSVMVRPFRFLKKNMTEDELDKVNVDNMEKINTVYRKYMHDIHHYFYQIRNLAMEGETQAIMDMINQVEGYGVALSINAFSYSIFGYKR